MEISQIVIEKRPRLQCANFFISFSENFVSQDSVKLSVQRDKILVTLENDRHYQIDLKAFFHLHTRTLSQLVIKRNYINFRVNTNESEFSSEVLTVPNEVNANGNIFKLVPHFNGPQSTVQCSNCGNILIPDHTFGRILELPSDNLDISEWFCHKPHNLKTHTFKPGTDEIFYGTFYLLLSMQNVKGVRHKGKLTYCRRCLLFIGELDDAKTKGCLKVWNDAVKFDEGSRHFFCSDLTQNFAFILKKLQYDFAVDTPGLPQLFKVVFETTLSSGKRNFLLLQIMDHKLEILQMPQEASDLKLDRKQVTKLLFKLEEDSEAPLVKFWLSCSNINTVQISPKMFEASLSYLTHMSKSIAECYRSTQGFIISYLDI